MIRTLASLFPNSYHLGFFACCREVHDPSRHSGCFGGTYQEAVVHFSALEERKQTEEDKAIEMKKLFAKLYHLENKISRLPV